MEFRRDDDYMSHLYNTYKVLYADFDDSGLPEEGIPEYNASQKIILAFILFIFNVFLLNMLISIMGNAFDQVQEGRILIDSLTKVNMIIENQSLMRVMKLTKKPSKKGYLMVCEQDSMVKEEEELGFKDIEKQIKSEFEQMQKEIKEEIKKQIKNEFEQMRKELTGAPAKKSQIMSEDSLL